MTNTEIMNTELAAALQLARDWIMASSGNQMLVQMGNPEVKTALDKIDKALDLFNNQ